LQTLSGFVTSLDLVCVCLRMTGIDYLHLSLCVCGGFYAYYWPVVGRRIVRVCVYVKLYSQQGAEQADLDEFIFYSLSFIFSLSNCSDADCSPSASLSLFLFIFFLFCLLILVSQFFPPLHCFDCLCIFLFSFLPVSPFTRSQLTLSLKASEGFDYKSKHRAPLTCAWLWSTKTMNNN